MPSAHAATSVEGIIGNHRRQPARVTSNYARFLQDLSLAGSAANWADRCPRRLTPAGRRSQQPRAAAANRPQVPPRIPCAPLRTASYPSGVCLQLRAEATSVGGVQISAGKERSPTILRIPRSCPWPKAMRKCVSLAGSRPKHLPMACQSRRRLGTAEDSKLGRQQSLLC